MSQQEFDSLVPELRLSRRGFIVTSLGAGFALATQPIMAQTAIKTDTEGLTAGEIQVPTADGPLPAYRAMPAGGRNLPTVLVVHESSVCTNTSRMSAAAWPRPAIWPLPQRCMPVMVTSRR